MQKNAIPSFSCLNVSPASTITPYHSQMMTSICRPSTWFARRRRVVEIALYTAGLPSDEPPSPPRATARPPPHPLLATPSPLLLPPACQGALWLTDSTPALTVMGQFRQLMTLVRIDHQPHFLAPRGLQISQPTVVLVPRLHN